MSSHPPQHLQLQKHDKYQPNERIGQDRQIAYRVDSERIPNSVALNTQTDPEYNSFEEAEAAFKKLLKRVNARPEWTWPETVRATVEDSQYRALKDPKDRKKAFEKYVVELRVQEKDKEKDRLAKLRSDFASMLRSHPEIKHYTRWKTARPIIKDELIFQSATSEDERKQLFQEYRVDLKKSHVSEEAENQKSALGELKEILGALNLEPYTRWSSAQVVLESNTHVQSDKKFQSLTKLDILKAFDEHIKGLERSFNEQRQKQKRSKARRERQAREGFLVLLTQLRSEGKIDVASKWMTTLPLIEEDPRYHAMLGNSGSSPLDLFWDLVEEDERALRIKRNDAMDVLEVGPTSPIFRTIADNIRTKNSRSRLLPPSNNSSLL
jgi:pre-mRNA-processing factor 40